MRTQWSYQRKLHLCPCLTSGGRRLKKHHQLYSINMSSNCFLMIKMEKMKYFDLNLVEKSGQKNVDQAFLFMNQVFVIFLESEFVCPSPELNWDWKTAWHWRWRMWGDRLGDTRWLHGLTWRNSKGSWVDVILPDRHHTPLISGLGGEGLGNEKNATALNQIEKNGHLKKEMSHSDDNFMVV